VSEPIVAELVETVAAVIELAPRATSLAKSADEFAPSAMAPVTAALDR